MRRLILLTISLLAACTSHTSDNQQAIKQVTDFYHFYLPAFLKDPPPPYDSAEMHRYVTADTLSRLAGIDKIPEQEIVSPTISCTYKIMTRLGYPRLRPGLREH
jgi:hypothetical protein